MPKTTSGAHSKGVLVLDESTDSGFYLMHSVPTYPEFKANGEIDITLPSSGVTFAQHFLCVSLTGAQINHFATTAMLANFNVYYSTANSTKYQNFTVLADKKASDKIRRKLPRMGMTEFQIGNEHMTYFVKDAKHGELLWDDIVTRYYEQNIVTATWRRPGLEPVCSDGMNVPNVENIESITISLD